MVEAELALRGGCAMTACARTADPAQPRAQALASANGRIVEVGSDREIRERVASTLVEGAVIYEATSLSSEITRGTASRYSSRFGVGPILSITVKRPGAARGVNTPCHVLRRMFTP